MVDEIRTRIQEVLDKEYVNSLYMDVNKDAYNVWAEHDWWVIPWFDILGKDDAAESKV